MDSQTHTTPPNDKPERRAANPRMILLVFIVCIAIIAAVTAINTTFGSNVIDADTARVLIAILISVALATLIFALFRDTVATFKWKIPGGPTLELGGAAALAAAFYFLIVAEFNPTTQLSLLLSNTDDQPFPKQIEVFARLDTAFYKGVYDPQIKSVTFFYIPKGSRLEFGVEGDAYVIESIGNRTDESCSRSNDSSKVVQLADNCRTVELIINNRGVAENIGINNLVIGMPIGRASMALGHLLDTYPLHRIRSELQRLGVQRALKVIYEPISIKKSLYEEKVNFDLVGNGNTKACIVIDAILSEYRKSGTLSEINFHVSDNTLTIYDGFHEFGKSNDCE